MQPIRLRRARPRYVLSSTQATTRYSRRRFLVGRPALLPLGYDVVDGIDELLDVVLAHRRREGAHRSWRHQDAVIDEPEKEIASLLLVGSRHRPVIDDRLVREMQGEHRSGAVHLHGDIVRGE